MPTETSLDIIDSLRLASGSAISVDATALLLVALFLGLMIYLNRALFQPYLRIITLRSERIEGVTAAAEATRHRAEEIHSRYQSQIDRARSEALEQKVAIRQSAKESQQEMTGEARADTEEILCRTRSDLKQELERAKGELENQAVALSSVIVAKILPK